MPTHADEIQERALYWVGRMYESTDAMSADEREAYWSWMFADPRHERAFNGLAATHNMMLDRPAAEKTRLQTWEAGYRAHSRRQFIGWWALAASVLVAMITGGYYIQSRGVFGESFVTRTGETRTVTFKEGSVAYLNTRTHLRWAGSERDRRIVMDDGEALFDVAHDAVRPFHVVLDNSEIRVLGTRFNVYRKPGGETLVTVLEGSVEVRGFGDRNGKTAWSRRLGPNQQIQYQRIGLMREPYATDAQNAVTWRTGVLRFNNEPVPNVFDELTRYTDQRIVVRDPQLSEVRVSGVLSTRNVRSALAHLQEIAPIEVQENNGTFTLGFKAPPVQNRKD